MRIQNLKWLFLLAVLISGINYADAQVRGRNRRNTATPNVVDTTKPQPVITNNKQKPKKYNPYGNTPIEKATSTGGFNDTIRRSLRNDAAYEKNSIKDRTPLPYENLRMDDALMTERIWREIDTREKINQVFRYKAEDDNGDQRFINILVNALMSE